MADKKTIGITEQGAQAKALIFVIVIAIVSLTQLYCSKKMEVEM